MSIPHSKVLSVTKGFGAVAQLHNNSPSTSQIVNVNIKNEPDRSLESEPIKDPQPVVYPPSEPNPYSQLADHSDSIARITNAQQDQQEQSV